MCLLTLFRWAIMLRINSGLRSAFAELDRARRSIALSVIQISSICADMALSIKVIDKIAGLSGHAWNCRHDGTDSTHCSSQTARIRSINTSLAAHYLSLSDLLHRRTLSSFERDSWRETRFAIRTMQRHCPWFAPKSVRVLARPTLSPSFAFGKLWIPPI